MNIALGSDEDRPVVHFISDYLIQEGHCVQMYPTQAWGPMALEVAHAVSEARVDQGIVCCWTGTGVALAANKVKGIRAALCVDAATAAGARTWNNANVLALSLRLLSEPLAQEILEAWFKTGYAQTEEESLALIDQAES